MTLNDFKVYVCNLANRPDSDSLDACAAFINARYKTIYDAYPWRDSELISKATLPTPGLISGGPAHKPFLQATYLPFPPGTDRIVKVGLITIAGGLRALTDLRPTDSAALLESRPDAILEYGTPEFYEEINDDNGRFIQIYPPIANTNFEFVIVGKKTINSLIHDSDEPILRNIDNVLIAYALADMLKRDRHYGKAAEQLKEAQALLQEAIDLEQKQSNAPRAARPLSITGGTLSELTDAVASRLNLWDSASQNKIVEAIRRNYQELYDRELWTESVVILSMQAQGGTLILPPYVDRVITVNDQANSTIDVVELEYLFRTNPAIFDAQGSPIFWSLLPPVGVAVLPEAAEQLSLVSDNIADNFNVSVYGESNGLIPPSEIVNVNAGATGFTANEYDVPLRISKPPSLGNLTISGASSLVKLGVIPADQSSVQYQRVWVQPIDSDTANGYYFVLGKRKLQQLISTVDAITIPRGCENALINLACGDLAPDGANRSEFKTQAEAQIATLISRETNQNARRVTVTPYTDRESIGTDSDIWLR